jgi:glycosyltransferase involved in cell wall biosynthesis
LIALIQRESMKRKNERRKSIHGVRVLFFGHTAALGGGEIALLNLLRNLDYDKVKPTVVLGAEGPLAEQLHPIVPTYVVPLSPQVAKAKKDMLGLTTLFRAREVLSVFAYILRLVLFIHRHKIDLVHTNSLKADFIGGIAGRLSLRPVVWHVRDRIEDDYLPGSVVRAFRFLCRVIPTYVIANSAATLRTLRLPATCAKEANPSVGEFVRRAAVVHDGTNLVVAPVRRSQDSDRFRIGLIGRISPWKGQHIFLRAAAQVHTQFPKARFVIIGAALFGEEKYDQEVRRLSGQLGIEHLVEFAGFSTNVEQTIAELDLVVHASTTGEPFGQVIIEGMAAGKPVVATDGGGVPEIVENGKTGILVPMGDVQAMADAICRILADPALAAEMGSRGRQRVADHFTVQQTARRVEAVYLEAAC